MTLVACPQAFLPDSFYCNGGLNPEYLSTLLDATTDRVGAVFYAPRAGDIHKIELRFGTVPALNASSTLTIGLQDVSLTSGFPDGTFDQSVTIANANIIANTTFKATLGSDRTVARGDLLSVVVQFNAFTAGDQVNILGAQQVQTRSGPFNYGYLVQNTTGSYEKVLPMLPQFSIEYSDGTYSALPSLWPVTASGTVLWNNTNTPDAIGLRFQVPFPCRIGGCVIGLDPTGNFDVVFYTSSGRTVVKSIDKDVAATSGMVSPVMFTAEQTLAANTTYVLAIEPTTTGDVRLGYVDVSSAAVLGQLSSGQEFHYATAKDPSTTADFTMTTTRRPMMGIIITALDNGGGGGAGAVMLVRRRKRR